MSKSKLLLLFTSLFMTFLSLQAQEIDLSGSWKVSLDGKKSYYDITLPGTTDDAGLGNPNVLKPELKKPQLLYLTRNNSFIGKAYYKRRITIPKSWKGKRILLQLERVIWKTSVWIDGKKVHHRGTSLVTPHKYDLTNDLSFGEHEIMVMVDNSKRFDDLSDMTHAYTEHTQIRWNGLLGKLTLRAVDQIYLQNVKLTPDINTGKVDFSASVKNYTLKNKRASLSYQVMYDGKEVYKAKLKRNIVAGSNRIKGSFSLENYKLWDEFNPNLYQISLVLRAGKYKSNYSSVFGMREISTKKNVMLINQKPIFLRGTLECCVFPLTGYPPTNKAGWHKVFDVAKQWGLNHLRFHSWCPPKAAFQVADEMGFYLQVELPVWSYKIGKSEALSEFLNFEAQRIISEYGNHPSFCLFSMGNELQGNMEPLKDMVTWLRKMDKRHLYTISSFSFEKGYSRWPSPEDDYFVTQWTKKGWVRGQGVFNSEVPSFDKNYFESVDGITVPLVTHEIGQYAVYPDLKEIKEYTGVLTPLNFMAVRDDLKKKGLLGKAEDYLQASGKLAAILYKEEVERALKTPGISGFQLLDLHDFPGQGTALVGLLNAFWKSKGIISSRSFRSFCSPIVPLLSFPKATYTSSETFEGKIDFTNYSNLDLTNRKIVWELSSADGESFRKSGSFVIQSTKVGFNANVGEVKVPLQGITKAQKLKIKLSISDSEYQNSWDIWVYPSKLDIEWGGVKYTRDYAEAMKLLDEGETVLFNPNWEKIGGIEGKFVPVFWSPVHFTGQAGTMGVLCENNHPAFQDFPTEFHSNWQWYDLNKRSKVMDVDSLSGGQSLVSLVDNFTTNRRLSVVYEGKVSKGKLLMTTIDLNSDLSHRCVARQMLFSLVNYMNSTSFNPDKLENLDSLKGLFEVNTDFDTEKKKSIYD